MRGPGPLTVMQTVEPVKIRRPIIEFPLSIAGGGISLAFSSSLLNYTQNYFVGNLLAENSFLLALIIVFVSVSLYEKPERHVVYGLVLMVLSLNQFVIMLIVSSSIPLTALGPAGAVLTLAAGFLSLLFQPKKRTPRAVTTTA